MRLGELEEARAVRVERLRRERLDRRFQALVAQAALDPELGFAGGERALERHDLLCTPTPLDESGPYRDEHRKGAERQTDHESGDDHRADAR